MKTTPASPAVAFLRILVASLGISSALAAPSAPSVITGISPNNIQAEGGIALTLTGHGLSSATSATVGGVEVFDLQVIDDHTLVATTSADMNAAVSEVSVTTAQGTTTVAGLLNMDPIQQGVSVPTSTTAIQTANVGRLVTYFNNIANSGFSGTFGWTFTVGSAANLNVTSLGMYDNPGTGLTNAHQIGIWDSNGTLVTSATVAAGTTDPITGGYRYVSTSAATLIAGRTYTIGAFFPANDAIKLLIQSPETIAPQITFGKAVQTSLAVVGAPIAQPTLDESTYSQGFFGPNFQFTSGLLTAFWKGGTDTVWSTNNANVTNWATSQTGTTNTGALPGTNTDVTFSANSPGGQSTTLGTDFSIKSLTVSSSSAVSIGGTNTLTISDTNAITVNSSAGPLTISTRGLVLSAASPVITVNGTASAIISSNLDTGTATINKVGTGTLTLTGTNTYTGDTGINGGTLQVSGGGSITQTSGLTLNFSGGPASNVLIDGSGKGGSITTSTNGSTIVAYSGTSTLTLQNGGTLSDALGRVGWANGSNGTANVDGKGSTWTNTNPYGLPLLLGNSGSGTLNVQNGGTVSNNDANNKGAFLGVMLAQNAGSTGNLNINSGGTLFSSTGVVGQGSGATGTVTVDGAGSAWTMTGNLTVDNGGTGSVTITNGAVVTNQAGILAASPKDQGTSPAASPSALPPPTSPAIRTTPAASAMCIWKAPRSLPMCPLCAKTTGAACSTALAPMTCPPCAIRASALPVPWAALIPTPTPSSTTPAGPSAFRTTRW